MAANREPLKGPAKGPDFSLETALINDGTADLFATAAPIVIGIDEAGRGPGRAGDGRCRVDQSGPSRASAPGHR